jgi:hypothetical protein
MFRHTVRAPMALAVVAMAAALPMVVAVTATGQEATPPPNVFSVRLEGYAVQKNTFSTATAVTPRTAYSFAKLGSVRSLSGERGFDLEARGANDQYQGFEGAVLFAGGMPTNGNNLPGYAQAFFPTPDGFSTIAEKCATNQTEAREAPECRDQDGPYALARVVPDQTKPVVEGIGRNQGNEDGGDARSHSLVEPQPDGSVRGFQSNSGSDQAVPGTPITVDSYVAEQTVMTTIGQAVTDIRCAGKVSVGGQPVNDDKQLQQALAPLTVASDLRVRYEPPTKPEIQQLFGGALQATCRGPRFTVFSGAQGGTGTTYTFGYTFAAVGVTENVEGFGGGDGAGVIGGGLSGPPAGPADLDTGSSGSSPIGSGGAGDPVASPPEEAPADAPEDAAAPPLASEPASNDLIRRAIDSTPIGLLTGAAAALLPLGIWLLLGVTGSLARGLPSLRLPPFSDDLS